MESGLMSGGDFGAPSGVRPERGQEEAEEVAVGAEGDGLVGAKRRRLASPERTASAECPAGSPPPSPQLSAHSSAQPSASLLPSSSSPPPVFARDDIQRLPDEILRRVFSFLHPRRRISAEGVCRRWERLSLQAWKATKTLSMRDFRVRDPRIRPLLSDSPFGALSQPRPSLVLKRQVVRSLWARAAPHLSHVDFSAAGTPGSRCCGPKFLHASVTWELSRVTAPNLASLTFERVKVEPASLAQALASLAGLRRLVLRDSFSENPGQDFSEAMSGLLQRSKELVELRLTHTISTCRWLAELPPSVQTLDLSRTRAPNLKLHTALDGTPGKFPALQTLDLANVGMSASKLNLALVAASAPNLRVLDLQYIYCEELENAASLAALPALASLNFFHYDPANLRPFVEAVTAETAACRSALRQLFVNAECLEEETVGMLGGLPKLERLCLGPTAGLGGAVLRALAQAPALQDLLLANPRGRHRHFLDPDPHDDSDDTDDN